MDEAQAFGLDAETAASLRECLARFPGVDRAWIYGSRARGDYRTSSDIDLMVDAPEWTDHNASDPGIALIRIPQGEETRLALKTSKPPVRIF